MCRGVRSECAGESGVRVQGEESGMRVQGEESGMMVAGGGVRGDGCRGRSQG